MLPQDSLVKDDQNWAMDTHAILIPVFNGEAHIAATLESALSQIGPIRILVSDDASTDGTAATLDGYRKTAGIEVITQERNLGLFANWNFLLRSNTSPSFTLISQDDQFASRDAVARGLEMLVQHPDCPAVFCDLEFVNDDGVSIGTRKFNRAARFNSGEWGRRSVIQCRNLFGIPLVVRRSAMIGKAFDERIRYVADLGFAIAVCSGAPPAHVPEPLIKYRVHGSNASLRRQRHVLAEMRTLAAINSYHLSPLERARQRMFALATTAGRFILFRSKRARLIAGWLSQRTAPGSNL